MTKEMDQLQRFDEIITKLGERADAILAEIEKAKRDEIKDKYIEAADKMCKNYCIIPRLFCYNGETSIEGMSRHCDECPLVKGYREICIL